MGRESWGYREDEGSYSHKYLMQSIDKVLAMGGNYLLDDGRKLGFTVDTIPWRGGERPRLRLKGLPVNEIHDGVMVGRMEFPESVAERTEQLR